MKSIEEIINNNIEKFLEAIKCMTDVNSRHKLSSKSGGFPIFWENRTYDEQTFFDEMIENLTWKFLVNGVFKDMFSDESCLRRELTIEWIKMHPQITSSYVENIEEKYPLEFILTFEDKKIGYRYTNCYWLEDKFGTVFRNYNLNEIIIIDFSSEGISTFLHPLMVPQNFCDKVRVQKLREFFEEFFSEENYTLYIESIKEAMAAASRYVGLQSIPNLTLQYLSFFTTKTLSVIHSYKSKDKKYHVINQEKLLEWLKERVNIKKHRISKTDYQVMDNAFYDQGRYYAMCGNKLFAQSFMTSEYLYQIMQSNNHFDYTVVVAGYLKSIEQFLYKMVLLTLDKGTDKELWIKSNNKKTDDPPEIRKIGNTNHVKFIAENKAFFDTSFASLVNLLNSNEKDWNVSKQAKNRIITCLHVFCAECRNEHFHKENIGIEDIDEVNTIRNNTIVLFYYLLGGYRYFGSVKEDGMLLGIKDRKYDEMYKAIMAQSAGGDYFIIQFNGLQPVLAALPMNHGEVLYNEDGLMKNPRLRFYKLDRLPEEDSQTDDWHLIETDVISDRNIIITPDNMPTSIQYVEKISGRRVEITW